MRLGDFARLTNIMSDHGSHRDLMWTEMSSEKKKLYGNLFHEFNKHLMKNYGMTSPKAFENSSLFRDFELALKSPNPPQTMICAPLTFKLFYFVIELMPIQVQYSLLDLMFRFGFRWKPPRLDSSTILPESS